MSEGLVPDREAGSAEVKESLESEKLRLEIADLARPWWKRPAYLGLPIPVLAVLLAFFTAIWAAHMNDRQRELTAEISRLNDKREQLEQARIDSDKKLSSAVHNYQDVLVSLVIDSIGTQGVSEIPDEESWGERVCGSSGDPWSAGNESVGDLQATNRKLVEQFSHTGLLVPTAIDTDNTRINSLFTAIMSELRENRYDFLISGLKKHNMLPILLHEDDLSKPYYITERSKRAFCSSNKGPSPERVAAIIEIGKAYSARKAAHDYMDAVAGFLVEEVRQMTMEELTAQAQRP